MAKCLVTGGAGFIGSHLISRLLCDDHSVVAFDHAPLDKLNNLFNLNSSSFKYVRGSVSDSSLFRDLINDADHIYLLAATLGVRRVIEKPIATANIQVDQVREICATVCAHQKIFYASTSEVYGKSNASPLTEDLPLVLGEPGKARWAYACSKLLSEYLLLSLYRDKNIPLVVGRFFNVVGPRQNQAYGAVVPNLLSQAIKGIPLTVFGDGTQTRSFCHVSDAVDAMLSLMNNDSCNGGVYNIGNDEEISIGDLADKIRNLFNPILEIKMIPYEDVMPLGFEEILHRVPSLNKIKRYTGWSSKIKLDEALIDCFMTLKNTSI
ncbi:MAG: NAD-dependent epimerase/dehydratase family protein [Planctomycetes bacterium]|nr:NAD-dependent epimerase/dehydratase family protein [Planctomycetota bacterium]NBY02650.1 NAD-dependent epimerase/dehydratase family protein [Planctomycetota bacterium]